jgi:hypothetical protein
MALCSRIQADETPTNDKLTKALIGVYLPVSDDSLRATLYQSMKNLWKNRHQHRLFIVNAHLPEAIIGMAALQNYCQANSKKLLIDIHQCKPGCEHPPDIIEGNNVDLKLEYKRCPNYKCCLTHYNSTKAGECHIRLEKILYDSMVDMAKMALIDLGEIYHETVPVTWNSEKKRLESIYGDIWYECSM